MSERIHIEDISRSEYRIVLLGTGLGDTVQFSMFTSRKGLHFIEMTPRQARDFAIALILAAQDAQGDGDDDA